MKCSKCGNKMTKQSLKFVSYCGKNSYGFICLNCEKEKQKRNNNNNDIKR